MVEITSASNFKPNKLKLLLKKLSVGRVKQANLLGKNECMKAFTPINGRESVEKTAPR